VKKSEKKPEHKSHKFNGGYGFEDAQLLPFRPHLANHATDSRELDKEFEEGIHHLADLCNPAELSAAAARPQQRRHSPPAYPVQGFLADQAYKTVARSSTMTDSQRRKKHIVI
jgi:hypothetical protein